MPDPSNVRVDRGAVDPARVDRGAVDPGPVDPLTGIGPVLAVVGSARGLAVPASPLPIARAGTWTVAGWSDHPDDDGAWVQRVAAAWASGRPAYDNGPLVSWAAVGRHEPTGELRALVQGGAGPGLTWWRGRGADGEEQLVLASHPAPTVARVTPRAQVDPAFLIGLLLLRDPPGGSPFVDVHRLPPGWEMRWRPGVQPLVRRWFRLEDIPPLPPGDPAAAVEAYRAALDVAVRAHLPATGDVGASLSGGLDSSAVVATAARALAGSGRSIHAWTHAAVPELADSGIPNWVPDETPLSRLLAARYPGTTVEDVRNTDRVLGIDVARACLPRTWLPTRNPQNQVWIEEIRSRARGLGLRTVLSGASGNAAFSPDRPAALGELLAAGRIGAVIDLARQRAERSGRSLALVLRAEAIWPLLPQVVQEGWRRAHGTATEASLDDYLSRLPLAPGAIERHGLDRVHEASRRLSIAGSSRAGWLAWLGLSYGLAAGQSAASYDGLHYADPLGTRTIMTAAASMPPDAWLVEGRSRALARAVMADRVPDEIRLRTQRGGQALDWYFAVSGQQERVLAAIAEIAATPSAGEILDIPRLQRMVTDNWPQAYDPQATGEWELPLSRSIAIGQFVAWWEAGGG